MKIEIRKHELVLNVSELVENMDAPSRANLSRYLVAEEHLFAAVLDCVVNGRFFTDDPDGDWWLDPTAITRLREKLVPLMSQVHRELCADLIRQRDQAKALQEQSREWSWKLYHAWPDLYTRSRPNPPRDFLYVERIDPVSDADGAAEEGAAS